MPGIFGGYGCIPEQYKAIKNHFETIWGACESNALSHGYLGGHAFSNESALHVTQDGLHFAVDGEHSFYKNAAKFVQKGEPLLFKLQNSRAEPGVHCKGNVAIIDQNNQTLYLVSEWTGSFPLYYTKVNSGLLFSSHLRPLSKVINDITDPIGIIQFMKYGFILAGRTFFKKIRRLLPGQTLIYQLENDHLIIHETSKAFRDDANEINFEELVEYSWTILLNAMRRCLEFSHKNALFSSSGWDSRLLLAVFRELDEISKSICYTHGDLRSREISLARQLYAKMGINYHLEPLVGDMFNIPALKRGFDCTENIIFPHYHWAGKLLAEIGIDCVSAGVLGEVMGGRHGVHWPMLPINEWQKIFIVAPYLLNFPCNRMSKKNKDIGAFYDFLHITNIRKPWYIRSDFWNSIQNIRGENYADMEEFVFRLKRRGVESIDKIAEAFTAEYFGSQYLTPQLLSCRSNVNVAIPFADQELFEITSQIPLSQKIVHTLQQAILRRYDSELLGYPNAAAFLNSKFPIPILEISRVFRKLYESISWKICRVTQGRYKPTPTGWSTFACLRDRKTLLDIADNLHSDLIDKNKIQNRIKNGLSQSKPDKSMYTWNAAQNLLMKIYNADLMLN